MGLEGGFWTNSKSVKNKAWIEKRRKDFIKLKPTVFETVFACDIMPQAKTSWESHFKRDGIFHLESIVDLVKKAKAGEFNFPRADIVTGGFPCNDFSISGRREGFKSHKSHDNKSSSNSPAIESRGMLYYWMKEAIGIIRPKVFIAENVKGLLFIKGAVEKIVKDFESLGYVVPTPKVLHSGQYGAPQARERIIFIGIRKDALKSKSLKMLESGEIDLYPTPTHDIKGDFVSVRDVISDLGEPENSNDIDHQTYSGAKFWLNKEGEVSQGEREVKFDGLSFTVTASSGKSYFRRLSKKHGGKTTDEYHLPERRLSVREVARIQTFSDDYKFIRDDVSMTKSYIMLGNAVPPLLAYHIAKRLEEVWPMLF